MNPTTIRSRPQQVNRGTPLVPIGIPTKNEFAKQTLMLSGKAMHVLYNYKSCPRAHFQYLSCFFATEKQNFYSYLLQHIFGNLTYSCKD